jgi:hypothetical protein
MKIDLTQVFQLGMSPNQLYLLYCLKRKQEARFINIAMETRLLEADGFIEGNKLTLKGEEALLKASFVTKTTKAEKNAGVLDEKFIENVSKYREMFPAMMFPSGKAARQSVNELTPRFGWFFTNYPQFKDWNLVFEATAFYLDEYEKKNWMFASASAFFIWKKENDGNIRSGLADYCQMVLDGVADEVTEARPSIYNLPGKK